MMQKNEDKIFSTFAFKILENIFQAKFKYAYLKNKILQDNFTKFRIQNLEFRIQNLEFRIQNLEFRISA